MKREPVAVLGGGAWGTILAQLFSHNVPRVPLWVRDAELREELITTRTHPRALPGLTLAAGVVPTDDLEAVVRGAELLILAVPTPAFRDLARRVGEFAQGDQILVSGAKGLEEGTGARMSEILIDETCVRRVGALAGPAYAGEMARGAPGAAVIGSGFQAVVERVQLRLASERIRVYGNTDLLGVELGGALTNIITFACGISDGLELGNGIKAVVLDRGLAEVTRLGVRLGAQASTFHGLSVLGDLMAAALSGESRNFRLGVLLARGCSLQEALEQAGPAECIPTTRMALELAQREGIETPLVSAMAKVLFEGVAPKDMIRELMRRRSIYEGA